MNEQHSSNTNSESISSEQKDKDRNFVDSMHEMIASLDEMLKGLENSTREAQYAHEKMYETKLPEALFHATTKANAKRIMLEGLKPKPLKFEDEEVIGLSDTVSFALLCASVTQGVDPGELVVLEVTTKGLNREDAKSFLQFPPPNMPDQEMHEVHYYKTINPDWIYQLEPQEVIDFQTAESEQ